MTARAAHALTLLALCLIVAVVAASAPAAAQAGEEGGASWRLEQPLPPKAPTGTPEASLPIGLGQIGDIEFFEPNRGLLITHGDGPAIPPGVWAYNGVEWHELAEVCGATEGSIAWAGPADFWTVSNGRPGQVSESSGSAEQERAVPLEDNTLCHFAEGRVVGSYAHPAFEADSYQAMHAAGCIPPQPPAVTSEDCWFGGAALPEPQIGAFHLHWNGSTLEAEPYLGEGHAVEDMDVLEGLIYESVRVNATDRVAKEKSRYPVIHVIDPEATPAIAPEEAEPPLYGSSKELTSALDFLHLSSAEGALWGAAGKSSKRITSSEVPGQVTVVRRVHGVWSQLIGPGSRTEGTPPNPLGRVLPNEAEETRLLGGEAANATVSALAAEPGGERAWLALSSPTGSGEGVSAVLLHISAEGKVLGEQTLPSAREAEAGIGPKGAAARLSCPAVEDCWMATTEGWLYHLAPEGERTLPRNEIPGFGGLITYRPKDQGLPQEVADAPPPDDSGLTEEPPDYGGTIAETEVPAIETKVEAPLLSDLHSRLIHKTTLELRFHLAVKARVRLLAKRHKKVVASTPMRTLAAGNRKLLLRLSRREWPTKLSLQTHALAPLPARAVGEGGAVPEIGPNGTVTEATDLTGISQVPTFAELGTRR